MNHLTLCIYLAMVQPHSTNKRATSTSFDNAKSFLPTLQKENLNISLYYVPPKDIDVLRETMTLLKAVPNTMRLHQIITDQFGEIFFREVSSSCTTENEHQGHALKSLFSRKIRSLLHGLIRKPERPHWFQKRMNKNLMISTQVVRKKLK